MTASDASRGAEPDSGVPTFDDAGPLEPKDCVPDATRCTPQQGLETCSSEGAWGAAAACPFVCTGAGICSGVCRPDDKRCDPGSPLVPQICSATGSWTSAIACASLCSSGSCSGSCTPGVRRCGAIGVPETCDAQGTWQPTAACTFVCTGAGDCTGECKPGAKDCGPSSLPGSAATPRSCGDDGSWTALATCNGQSCAVGSCIGECVAQQTRCSPAGVAQTCSGAGHWTDGALLTCTSPNLALGASVTASTTIDFLPTFSKPGLVDGNLATAYSTAQRDQPKALLQDGSGCADWVAVEMSGNTTFSTVVLVPRQDTGHVGQGFPASFSIDLWDGEKFITRLPPVAANPGSSLPTTPQRYSWGYSDTTTRVRICAQVLTEDPDHHFFMQIAELQLLQ